MIQKLQNDKEDGMSKLTDVTMGNTKKEMLDAFESAKERIQEQQKALSASEAARKKLEAQAFTIEADKAIEQSPVERLNQLRSDMVRELNALAGMYESELVAYQRVKLAGEAKQAELKTLHEIDVAASDLEALISAQQQQKVDFEQTMHVRRKEWEQEEKAHLERTAQQKSDIEMSRKREAEEYAYSTKRERDRQENEFKDQMERIQQEIKEKSASFDLSVKTKEDELSRREGTVAEREAELADLGQRVEQFANEKEAAVKSACGELSKRLESDFQNREALMQARFDGERNVMLSKIEVYEKQLAELVSQLSESAQKQEHAYEKVQDIASKAVAAAKREIISIPADTSTKES